MRLRCHVRSVIFIWVLILMTLLLAACTGGQEQSSLPESDSTTQPAATATTSPAATLSPAPSEETQPETLESRQETAETVHEETTASEVEQPDPTPAADPTSTPAPTPTPAPSTQEQIVTLLIDCRLATEAGLPGAPENGLILPPTETAFQEGESVFDLLARIARQEGIAVGSTGSGRMTFVTHIAGLAAFDAKSGWMFSLNGEYVMAGAGATRVNSGDMIAWHYTLDSGRDLP